MREMARGELPALEGRLEILNERLKILLLPKDPNDERDVILEVRAGAGGDEAGLFASEVLRMYLRYAERRNWRATLMGVSTHAGGGGKGGGGPPPRRGGLSRPQYTVGGPPG